MDIQKSSIEVFKNKSHDYSGYYFFTEPMSTNNYAKIKNKNIFLHYLPPAFAIHFFPNDHMIALMRVLLFNFLGHKFTNIQEILKYAAQNFKVHTYKPIVSINNNNFQINNGIAYMMNKDNFISFHEACELNLRSINTSEYIPYYLYDQYQCENIMYNNITPYVYKMKNNKEISFREFAIYVDDVLDGTKETGNSIIGATTVSVLLANIIINVLYTYHTFNVDEPTLHEFQITENIFSYMNDLIEGNKYDGRNRNIFEPYKE